MIRQALRLLRAQGGAHQPWAEMMQITSYTVSDLSSVYNLFFNCQMELAMIIILQYAKFLPWLVIGKIVLSGELIQNSFGQFGIEMSALPKGLYFVKFSGVRINKVDKVVKE